MSATQISLPAGQTSRVFLVSAGERVTTTGTGKIQYTLSGFVDISNNLATWLDWPSGSVAGFDDAVMAVYCRGVATSAMTIVVGDSDTALDGTLLKDGVVWKGQSLSANQIAALLALLPGGGVTGPLTPYFDAILNRNAAPVEVLVVGDSWAEYRTATAFGKQWTQLVQAQLRSRFPTNVIGSSGGIGYVPIRNVSIFAPYANPWVLAGATTLNSTAGGLGLRYTLFTTSSDKATITVTGTSCILHYLKASSSRVGYYKVDGGAAVTFETNNGVVSDDGFLPITLGASGSHTLEVGWSSGGQVYIAGAMFFNGDETKGFHFYEGGHTAYRVADYLAAPAHAVRVAAINPHLLIIALGQNDFALASPNFRTAAQYQSDLTAFIVQLRTAGVTSPILIMMSADVTAVKDVGQTSTWAQYIAAARAVAAADTSGPSGTTGIAVAAISETGRIPPSTGSAGGLWADGGHVGDAGHVIVSDIYYSNMS